MLIRKLFTLPIATLMGSFGLMSTIAVALIFVSGCQCEDPDGCRRTITPKVELNISLASGTYSTPQTVTITSSNALAIYYTVDGTTPTAENCNAYDGSPIPISNNTALRVLATGDGETTRNKKQYKSYYINQAASGNQTALIDWLLLEKYVSQDIFAQDPNCTKPVALEDLEVPQVCSANCPDGGTITLNYSGSSYMQLDLDGDSIYESQYSYYTNVIQFNACQGYGITATGVTAAELELPATLPAVINQIDPNPIILTGSRNAIINDSNAVRSLDILTGSEPYVADYLPKRTGNYLVTCTDADCYCDDGSCSGDPAVNFYHGTVAIVGIPNKGRIYMNDPEEADSCPAQ